MRDASLETLSVAQIMLMCPATIRLFIAWRLHCVGCPIGPFHTLRDAALEHGVDAEALVAAVAIVVNGQIKDGPA